MSTRPPYPPGRPLPCCVEVPEALVAPARHGVEVLMTGLGLDPVWSNLADLRAGGLYYGVAPEAAPAGACRLRMDSALAAGEWDSVDPAGVSVLEWEGVRWPLLHPAYRVFGPISGEIEEADVIASAHAWTSGRLEQQVRRRDIHGRLRDDDAPPAALAAARADLVDGSRRPVVDAYRRWLGAAMARAGIDVPGRAWAGRTWALIPTVDVDLVRTRRPRAALRGDPRQHALAGLVARLTRDSGRASFFLKAGATARYDVDYPLDHAALGPVWDRVRAGEVELGLHPSYFAHDHAPRLRSELAALRSAAATTGRDVSPLVRTHYLRWTEPGTPRALEAAGARMSGAFAIDSTLGFSARAGFRRGTSVPYRLFDVQASRALNLWEVPLAVMDTALFVHSRVADPGVAIEEAMAGAREAGGACVLLWHNEPRGAAVRALDEALASGREAGALIDGVVAAVEAWAVAGS